MIKTGNYHQEQEEIMQHTENASTAHRLGATQKITDWDCGLLEKPSGTARPRKDYFRFILLFIFCV